MYNTKILTSSYRRIVGEDIPNPSTSIPHKAAHKLFVEWLLSKQHKGRILGTLTTEQHYGNGYWADVVAYWRGVEKMIETIEVQYPLGYMHCVPYQSRQNFDNKIWELLKLGVVNRPQYDNIRMKANRKGRPRNKGFLHFCTSWNDRALQRNLSFAESLDNPPELQRKHEKWKPFYDSGNSDEISFVIPAEYEDRFYRDADGLEGVAKLYLMKTDAVKEIIKINGNQGIGDGIDILKKPKGFDLHAAVEVAEV